MGKFSFFSFFLSFCYDCLVEHRSEKRNVDSIKCHYRSFAEGNKCHSIVVEDHRISPSRYNINTGSELIDLLTVDTLLTRVGIDITFSSLELLSTMDHSRDWCFFQNLLIGIAQREKKMNRLSLKNYGSCFFSYILCRINPAYECAEKEMTSPKERDMALVHSASTSLLPRLFFMKINYRYGNDGILSASSDAMRHVNDRPRVYHVEKIDILYNYTHVHV